MKTKEQTEQLVFVTGTLMEVVAGNISTGKAREILRDGGIPEKVVRMVMAPLHE